jgi:hypothetical protein
MSTPQQLLVILSCSDTLMWYRDLVGQTAPLIRYVPEQAAWLSRERCGYINIIKVCDAAPMPIGYRKLDPAEIIQHRDLLLDAKAPEPWQCVPLVMLGAAAGQCIVIRAAQA